MVDTSWTLTEKDGGYQLALTEKDGGYYLDTDWK
jgi:hypothetical protein